jgi:DNA (cytosine-5)-methyltransferase 1
MTDTATPRTTLLAQERPGASERAFTVGSLFSGVGGFDLGFRAAGFETRWMCEIDRDCQDVLRKQFPETDVIYSNILTMPLHDVERVDVIIGGFPCQDLSVAGRRAGLDGSRSGLFFEFARVIGELRPALVVMENVPGLLSSNGGRDMAVILGTLRDIGARDIAWCVLDAQWFGVPQRRRRVFLVADFAGERASSILALPEGLSWHPPPRREAGEAVTQTLRGGAAGGSTHGKLNGSDQMPMVAASLTSGSHPHSNRPGRHSEDDVNLALCLTAHEAKGGDPTVDNYLITHSLHDMGHGVSEDGTGRGTAMIGVRTANTHANGHGIAEDVTHTLDGAQGQAVAFNNKHVAPGGTTDTLRSDSHGAVPMVAAMGGGKPGEGYSAVAFTERGRRGGVQTEAQEELAYALRDASQGGAQGARVGGAMGVRRLTPTECSRLMGWPDDWCARGASGKEMSDSTQYRMAGNGVVSTVAHWIAERIKEVLHD